MTEKGRKPFFDDYFSSIFSHSNVFSQKEYQNSLSQFELNYEKFLPSLKKAKILDVGCGAGHFLYYLEKKGFTDFLGIDISPQQVGFCRENISQRVKQADAFEFLQGKESAFDAIVANDLLEHIPKEETIPFLKLVHAALKDKGIFLVRTPNMGNPFSLYPRYKDFTHEAGFTFLDSRIPGYPDTALQELSGRFPETFPRIQAGPLDSPLHHQALSNPGICRPSGIEFPFNGSGQEITGT